MTPSKKIAPANPPVRKQRGRVDRSAMFPVAASAGEMPADYAVWLAEIKSRIQGERLRLVLASNSVMIMLYWDIGRRILQKQAEQGYGTKVVDRLAADLRDAFPEMKGFSPRNLKYMRAFAAAWPDREVVQAALAQVTWYHNLTLLEKLDKAEDRLWYAARAIEHGWSRNILSFQIEGQAHRRHGKAQNNFPATLPPPDSDMAVQVFKDPYLLIAEDGENLRTRQTPIALMARGKSWVNNHAHIVTGNERANTRFLMYAIQAQDVSPYLTGAVMPKLTQGNLNKIPITHPKDVEDQRAIAHILGTLDDKIELNRRMNETLEAMARAIFKSWFVDFDPVRAKASGEPPESICRRLGLTPDVLALFPDGFQDSELGEVPRGWTTKALKDVMEVNPPRALRKGCPSPYLDMANMPTSSARASEIAVREFGSGMKFKNGDTLVARITPCLENGKTCFVDFLSNGEIGWGSTEYIVLRPKPPLPPEYAYFLARTDSFRSHAIANMTGTSGRQRVPATAIEDLKVVVPREDGLAVAFGGFASAVLALMRARDLESNSLSHVRTTLLPKLLSGDLSVTDAERFMPRQAS